jgi:uncharacterized protein
MYPSVTQLETRALELERHARHRRARRSATLSPAAPPRYKLAVLTWVGAYAVITPLLALLGPKMASWPLLLRTLVLSVTMVVSLTWLIMPRLTRLFRGWLTANPT